MAWTLAACVAVETAPIPPASLGSLSTVAIRVHRLDAMVAFYSQAFGFEFQPQMTRGIQSQFGQLGAFTLKLVPLRDSVEFEDFPSHQLGFEVASVDCVLALAEQYGGRQEGSFLEQEGRRQGAVRDPDGNTVEIYERR
jgi:catechol 2,3-dioxygenase-like lactoylglutathione lyase family enzyme